MNNCSNTPNAILEIDWKKLKNNVLAFRAKMDSKTKLMLMLKAEAYGTEANTIAKLIERENLADYIAVANLEEGIRLRKANIQIPILLLNPNASDWQTIIEYCIEPEIHNLESLDSFDDFLSKMIDYPRYPIHLHINTGMNHIGIEVNEIPELIKLFHKDVQWEVKSIMSHLSSSDLSSQDEYTLHQVNTFEKITAQIEDKLDSPVIKHILNSNGLERFPEHQYNMVRLGIGIHGASNITELKEKLEPNLKLVTQVCAIRKVSQGETIGYSRRGIAKDSRFIATIPVGYADGFCRELGNGNWQVEIAGKLYPTIGNVCMDLSMIDLGRDQFNIGEEVTIFGKKLSIFDFAEAQKTITYEAMTRIGSRVKRKVMGM